jgi:hypothetical protein
VLAIGGAAAAAGALGPLARPLAATAARTRWPTGTLGDVDALQVDPSQFMPAGQFESWLRELDRLGPAGQKGLRATGSQAHEHYIDVLGERLERAGATQLEFESVPMMRWTTNAWSLEVLDGESVGPVTTASYIPYSGQTSREGVTGQLALVPKGTTPAPGSLVGKIAVFDVPLTIVPNGFFTRLAYPGTTYDPHQEFPPQELYKRPWFNSITKAQAALRLAGAAAIVGVIDYPPDGAYGSYFPYTGEILDLPGLYVDREAGAQLKQQALAGANAQLALPAKITEVRTRNIVAFIPGASSELVMLHSHTDGTNALEENGPTAIVAMSQYLARLPSGALPRTVMILLTSGHFAGGVGARTFVARHADDLVMRTNAAVTLEHLGAREWGEQADGTMGPTGRWEFAAVFAPRTQALVNAAHSAVLAAEAAPSAVLRPLSETSEPAWPGEGEYFYALGGMPDANYITGPSYLLNWGITTRDKIDVQRMRAESIAFTNMVLALTRTPRAELRVVNLP